jgi:cytochrome oxidase Cu insertion factor (SCO1/SenC/PrrC family)
VTPRTLNRVKLLCIGAIAVAPVLGSYLLYWFWAPNHFTNYGTLIEPKPVPNALMEAIGGGAFGFEQLRGRWVFVTVDSGKCETECESKLWKMRQVRQTQGQDLGRIERVFLLQDDQVPREQILNDYKGTWFVRTKDEELVRSFVAPQAVRNHIYLIDPLGNLILRFPEDADPKLMLKDMTRLLRYSGVD